MTKKNIKYSALVVASIPSFSIFVSALINAKDLHHFLSGLAATSIFLVLPLVTLIWTKED